MLPVKTPLTVGVTYHNNDLGLLYTLTMLQNQTVKPDRIVVIDTSPSKKGLDIVKQYSYNDIPIVVECATTHINTAWNKCIDLSGKDHHVLIINDDLIFPINMIAVMKYAIENQKALVHVPETISREFKATYIKQKYEATCTNEIKFVDSEWMTGFCYLLTRQAINEVGILNDKKYQIWFGDTDYEKRVHKKSEEIGIRGVNKIKGLFVYHFGGSSYKYGFAKTLRTIAEDRKNYKKEYEKN